MKPRKKRRVQLPVVGACTKDMGQGKGRRKINRRWHITQQAKVDMRKAARSTVGRGVVFAMPVCPKGRKQKTGAKKNN
ncbi:MAG: hypothetical protein WBM69_09445, partial [Desulfobacterales bacterium]